VLCCQDRSPSRCRSRSTPRSDPPNGTSWISVRAKGRLRGSTNLFSGSERHGGRHRPEAALLWLWQRSLISARHKVPQMCTGERLVDLLKSKQDSPEEVSITHLVIRPRSTTPEGPRY